MLKTLHCKDLGIIEDLVLDFSSGLVCLTGETGAGKSLVVDGLQLVLGARGDPSLVRHGARSCIVEAIFEVEGSEYDGGPDGLYAPEDGEVRVTRVVGADGRSKAFIQGRLVAVRDLRRIIGKMVTIAGQHAFTSLCEEGERLVLLDAFGGLEGRVKEYEGSFRRWKEGEKRLEEMKRAQAERLARQDYLEFVVKQIEAARVQKGEVERLLAEANVLRQADRLKEAIVGALRALVGREGAALDGLSEAVALLGNGARIYKGVEGILERLEAVRIEVKEVARDLEASLRGLDLDPGRLYEVESRLKVLQGLMRKYGGSEEAVLRTLEEAKRELEVMASSEMEIERLEGEVAQAEAKVLEMARELSRLRREAAPKISEAVTKTLRLLGMEGATFEVLVEETPAQEKGIDKVEFLVETNPGEGKGRVEERASGGELSRIALAIYGAIASSAGTPVVVFDEIDVGVSGGVAEAIGEMLAKASKTRQILVVTHHPQIAARARTHFVVEKAVTGGRTVATARQVEGEERVLEIARMLGGKVLSETAIAHAKELLMRGAEVEQ